MPPLHRSAYPKDLTDHSYRVLLQLVGIVPDAILIGGWGTWVRQQGLMSHDIDLIVDHSGRDAIFEIADDHSQSNHLGGVKWRAELDGVYDNGVLKNTIHVDLYVPYQSRLGARLDLVVERLETFAEHIDEWRVLDEDAHAATKLAALLDRPESQPGEKDRVELFGMLPNIEPERLAERLAAASTLPVDELANLVSEGFDYLKDLHAVGRSERRAIDTFIARTNAFVRERRAASDAVLDLEAVSAQAIPIAGASPSSSGTAQCEFRTANGTRCEMKLTPGVKCPHHDWVAPLL